MCFPLCLVDGYPWLCSGHFQQSWGARLSDQGWPLCTLPPAPPRSLPPPPSTPLFFRCPEVGMQEARCLTVLCSGSVLAFELCRSADLSCPLSMPILWVSLGRALQVPWCCHTGLILRVFGFQDHPQQSSGASHSVRRYHSHSWLRPVVSQAEHPLGSELSFLPALCWPQFPGEEKGQV